MKANGFAIIDAMIAAAIFIGVAIGLTRLSINHVMSTQELLLFNAAMNIANNKRNDLLSFQYHDSPTLGHTYRQIDSNTGGDIRAGNHAITLSDSFAGPAQFNLQWHVTHYKTVHDLSMTAKIVLLPSTSEVTTNLKKVQIVVDWVGPNDIPRRYETSLSIAKTTPWYFKQVYLTPD